MFRRLRLQFILTNLTISILLLISLATSTYLLLFFKMINYSEFFCRTLANGINSGMFPAEKSVEPQMPPRFKPPEKRPGERLPFPPDRDGMPGPPERPPRPLQPPPDNRERPAPFFFVKVRPTGELFFKSSHFPHNSPEIGKLIKTVVAKREKTGIIPAKQGPYYYYKTALEKEQGVLIIFQNLRKDRQTQYSLVWPLIIIGTLYIILVFFGSVFMAKRAIGPIQEAWEQQRDFIANASHELRTPLAVIQTNLEVVLDNREATIASQQEWLLNIHEELQQMTGLVNSLLFLARADSHQWVLNKQLFDFTKMITRVCDAFKPMLAAKEIALVTSLQDAVFYCGEEASLRQVLHNLLDNAVRHTSSGGKITIVLERMGKKVVVSVKDTGEGIAAEHLDKIFDRFYQADSSRANGKTGLGLAIVKLIVENHGGTIQVSSQPGIGTTFTLQLPYDKGVPSALTGNTGIGTSVESS